METWSDTESILEFTQNIALVMEQYAFVQCCEEIVLVY